ncbi:hypothetical protein ACIG87_26655 [Micromonospora sp. NPDC051925]|uniref:hypothetical protein n=1 Tax=Micromonospora sp. NPDC051925 TaxID=3364288 RepID=UPI0037C6075E
MAIVPGELGVRVPVGSDAQRWATVSSARIVLAVGRTVTSTVRLLEVLDLFRDDVRVQVVFAVDPGSVFGDGVRELLVSVGAKTVSWDRVATVGADLVVTASENVELAGVVAPMVVLPHGVGFHKLVPGRDGGVRVSGVVPDRMARRDDVVMVVSHPGQIAQLKQVSPLAADRAVVAGDLTYDRFVASARWRDRYRRSMGVENGRRLVVLSSTWRSQSLWGQWRNLPEQVLAALPSDEYQVAMILHPNVWFGHGPWQVRTWLARAREAGLMVVPPTAGWQAAVVAADVVVGDHGSVTFYAAASGAPILLGAFGDEAVPATAMAELGRLADRLDPGQSIRSQLDAAIAEHRPGRLAALTGEAFALVGQASATLRDLLYERLNLPALPGAAAVRAWPVPVPERSPVASFVVYTTVDAAAVVVRRYPAAVEPYPEDETDRVLRHRAVYDDEADLRSVENASVIVRRDTCDEATATAWAIAELDRNPGVRLTAASSGHTCVAVLDDRRRVTATSEEFHDPMLPAAAIYTLLRLETLRDGEVMVRIGGRQTSFVLRVETT